MVLVHVACIYSIYVLHARITHYLNIYSVNTKIQHGKIILCIYIVHSI